MLYTIAIDCTFLLGADGEKMLDIVQNDTCFAAHARYGVRCERRSCRNWIDDPGSYNCVMISARRGPKTLQEIGEIFNLTRMRICQIEKGVCKKIQQPMA